MSYDALDALKYSMADFKVKKSSALLSMSTETLKDLGWSFLVENNPTGYNQYMHNPFPDADEWKPATGHGHTVGTHTFEGGFFHSPSGTLYYVKKQHSPEQARVEVATNKLLHLAGVKVAPAQLVMKGGELHVASQVMQHMAPNIATGYGMNSHAALGKFYASQPGVLESFPAHAWLGSWDAAGTNYSNVINHSSGVHFIDHGGSMHFRAMGGTKDFPAGLPQELQSMKSNVGHETSVSHASHIFQHATDDHLKQGAEKLSHVSNADIKHVIDSVGLPAHVADTLIARKEATVKEILAKPPHLHDNFPDHTHSVMTGVQLNKYAGGVSTQHVTAVPPHEHEGGDLTKAAKLHDSVQHVILGKEVHSHDNLVEHVHESKQGDFTSAAQFDSSKGGHQLPHEHPVFDPNIKGWDRGSAISFAHEIGLSYPAGHSITHQMATGNKTLAEKAMLTYYQQESPKFMATQSSEQKASWQHYVGSGYSSINSHFRAGKSLASAGNHAQNAVAGINQSPGLSHETIALRGVHGTYGAQLKAKAVVGHVEKDLGFMSASLTSGTPINGIGHASDKTTGVLLVLRAPKGYQVAWPSNSGERELIFKPSTQFRIDAIEPDGGRFKKEGAHFTVYGTIIPHTAEAYQAAPASEKALYKMPQYKTYPKCPYCGGHYKDIVQHVLEGKSGLGSFKEAHGVFEQKNPKLPEWFKSQGVLSHTHEQSYYGQGADGKWGQQIKMLPEHFHNPATNGKIYVPGSHISGPTAAVPDHKHNDPHTHDITGGGATEVGVLPHIHYGGAKGDKFIKGVGGNVTPHKHLPNGTVEKL